MKVEKTVVVLQLHEVEDKVVGRTAVEFGEKVAVRTTVAVTRK